MIPPTQRPVIDVLDDLDRVPAFVSRRVGPVTRDDLPVTRDWLMDRWPDGVSPLAAPANEFAPLPGWQLSVRALVGLMVLAFAFGYLVAWCVA